jgi:hypothetical protein
MPLAHTNLPPTLSPPTAVTQMKISIRGVKCMARDFPTLILKREMRWRVMDARCKFNALATLSAPRYIDYISRIELWTSSHIRAYQQGNSSRAQKCVTPVIQKSGLTGDRISL